MKKADLITIAGDLNKILGLDPPIETDKNAKQDSLEEKIKEAVRLLEPGDKLEDDTVRHLKTFLDPEDYEAKELTVMESLGIIDLEEEAEEPEETEPEEAEEVTLEDEIEACTSLKQLKDIARAEDEFKALRGELTKYKTKDDMADLMNAMLDVLAGEGAEAEEAEEAEQEAPEKKPKESPKKKEEKKPAAKSPKAEKFEHTQQLEKSAVIKGMVIGSMIEFTTAPNSKVAPSTQLTGKVVQIKNCVKAQQEVVRVKTPKHGYFHKMSKSVTLKK